MSRRMIAFMVLVTGIVTIATGCSSVNGDHGLSSKNPQEIEVWNYYNGAQSVAFDNMVNEFNSTVGKEKGILVTAESTSSISDLTAALNASANKEVGAKKLPNIVQCYKDMATGLDQKDLLVSLDDYVDEKEKATFADAYIEDGKIGQDKEWKLFPIAKSTEIMMLNKQSWDAFFRDTGIQLEELSTWEGVASVAEEYYNWSEGDAFFGRDAFTNYMLIGSQQLGHPICEPQEDGSVKIELDTATMHTLWDNFYIPYIKGYYSHIGKYRTDDVKIGKIIAEVGSTVGATYFPTEVSVHNEDPYPIDCIVMEVPNFAGPESYIAQQGADMAVIKGTEQEEYASVLFLEWFTQVSRNTEFAVQTGYLPVRKEANTKEAISAQLETTETELGKIGKDVLMTAVEELNSYHVYMTAEFDESYQVRQVLEDSMQELAKADYEEIQTKIQEGQNREEVLAEYTSEEYFQAWMKQLQNQLNEILKK